VCKKQSTYHLLPVQRPEQQQPPPFAWVTLLLKEKEILVSEIGQEYRHDTVRDNNTLDGSGMLHCGNVLNVPEGAEKSRNITQQSPQKLVDSRQNYSNHTLQFNLLLFYLCM
jgi:hypothetical protein